jgi:hypothetical protein
LMKQNSRDIEETGRKLGISRFLMWIWAYCAGTFDQDWIKFKGYCAFFFSSDRETFFWNSKLWNNKFVCFSIGAGSGVSRPLTNLDLSDIQLS